MDWLALVLSVVSLVFAIVSMPLIKRFCAWRYRELTDDEIAALRVRRDREQQQRERRRGWR